MMLKSYSDRDKREKSIGATCFTQVGKNMVECRVVAIYGRPTKYQLVSLETGRMLHRTIIQLFVRA